MAVPLRAMPQLGHEVRIEYLAATVHGIVHRIDADGRRLEVVTEDGSHVSFALNPATATFTVGGALAGARLRF